MAVPVKRTFVQKFYDFMESEGFVDFVFAGRKVDSNMEAFSTWGTGRLEDSVSDRERCDVLIAEMERLKLQLILNSTPTKRA